VGQSRSHGRGPFLHLHASVVFGDIFLWGFVWGIHPIAFYFSLSALLYLVSLMVVVVVVVVVF
jgi:hypothetical protein